MDAPINYTNKYEGVTQRADICYSLYVGPDFPYSLFLDPFFLIPFFVLIFLIPYVYDQNTYNYNQFLNTPCLNLFTECHYRSLQPQITGRLKTGTKITYFLRKIAHFLCKIVHFLCKIVHFLCKIVHFLIPLQTFLCKIADFFT